MSTELETGESVLLRQEMVAEQLLRRGIDDTAILDAFSTTPRHLFVTKASVFDAYADRPLPIKSGQTISQPYIVALMIEYLNIQPSHAILEIGSGSGYATAVMSKLCRQLTAIEVYSELLKDSRLVLDRLGLLNVELHHGSAWEQFKTEEVYDRIILWASPPRIPDHLFDCLREGGILVAPEGKSDQFVWICKKQDGKIIRKRKDPVRFVPLVQGSVQEIDRKLRG